MSLTEQLATEEPKTTIKPMFIGWFIVDTRTKSKIEVLFLLGLITAAAETFKETTMKILFVFLSKIECNPGNWIFKIIINI